MERRTYESPMDWEYQTHGPMDPSSPFVQSARRAQQQKDVFGSSSSFGTFGQNNLSRTHSTPSKPLPFTPSQPASIFSTSNIKRTATAPPFRNPAFTTPRKPLDADAFSEASPAESSPTATDVSDLADTPENDRSYDLNQMTITPATMSRHKNVFSEKRSGKGEIARAVFSDRDKVRKRKRYNDNRSLSNFRLPYRQPDEWDGTDYDSDESTAEPADPRSRRESRRRQPKDGWFANLLSVIQRHPHAPAIVSYWVTTLFNFLMVSISFYLAWIVWSAFREDFQLARGKAKADIIAEIERCTHDYTQNKCHPINQRLPAIHRLCEEWYECMIQNEDGTKTIRTVILELVEMLNSAIEALTWKALAVLGVLLIIFLFSGASLVKTVGGGAGDMFRHAPPPPPPTPYPSSAYHPHHHPADRIAWDQIPPQTPSRHFNPRHLTHNDETPETDASPPPPPRSSFRALAAPPPQTPSSRRSPTKLTDRERERERGRSPTKSRSPTKRY